MPLAVHPAVAAGAFTSSPSRPEPRVGTIPVKGVVPAGALFISISARGALATEVL